MSDTSPARSRFACRMLPFALLLTLLCTPGAVADHEALYWTLDAEEFVTFGENATIRVFQGALEYVQGCASDGVDDVFAAITDVYIVPSGTVAPGSGLKDVGGGIPNTILAGPDGAFADEILGFTKPDGRIGPGRYAVVYDHCQDGVLDSRDALFDPAFEVVVTGTVPPLPDLTAIKRDALARSGWAAHALAAWKIAMFLDLIGDLGTLIDLNEGAGVYDKVIAVKGAFLEELGPSVYWPLGAAEKGSEVVLGGMASHYLALALDPPDADYQRPTPLLAQPPDGPTSARLSGAFVRLGRRLATEAALAGGLLASLEKYQGAALRLDAEFAFLHGRAVQAHARALASQLEESERALDEAATALAGDATDLDEWAVVVRILRDRLAAEGLRSDERRLLMNLGATADGVDRIVESLLSEDGIEDFSKAGLAALMEERAELAAIRDTLLAFADEMSAVLEALERTGVVFHQAPVADAGGPYDAVEGVRIGLDGSRATDVDGDVVIWEWDLDLDGEFDDASGSLPSVTFPHGMDALVGLRAADETGRAGIGYGRVVVADVNGPPSLATESPPGAVLSLAEEVLLEVVAEDPDGDPVSVTWLLDGEVVATGSRFTYRPRHLSEVGLRRVTAIASDGRTEGGAEGLEWLVVVTGPDADLDGWWANADCEDADPTVHPGMPEVPNLRDDDCNPDTPDTASPPAVDFWWTPEFPKEDRTLVRFVDASSDADGSIVKRLWRFSHLGWTSNQREVWLQGGDGYYDNGPYTVTLTVTDDAGFSSSLTKTVTVVNVPPAVTSTGEKTLTWGDAWQGLAPFDYYDPGMFDWLSLRFDWDFGDGTLVRRVGVSQALVGHVYATPGVFTSTLTVTDKDGGVGSATARVTVLQRPTAVVVTRAVNATAEGDVEIEALLMDLHATGAPLVSRMVTFSCGTQRVEASTDGTGLARAILRFVSAATNVVSVEFGGDTHYAAARRTTSMFAPTLFPRLPELTQRETPDNRGTEFFLAFGRQHPLASPHHLLLYLAADVPTLATISAPASAQGPGFGPRVYAVHPGEVTTVDLPTSLATFLSGSQNPGIHVRALHEIAVYGLNQAEETTDGYLALPADVLGTDHVVASHPSLAGVLSQLQVVATEDDTQVTIVPSADVAQISSHISDMFWPSIQSRAGEPVTFRLNRLQTYQMFAAGFSNPLNDLTGTVVTADKPVSVFGSHQCSYVHGAYCDHLAEQIPPTTTWGRHFLTVPLATRLAGDVWRVVAARDGTEVRIDGVLVATLARGRFHEAVLPSTQFSAIETTEPVLVVQYSKGSTADGVTSDPFMMMIPPTEQFASGYTFSTPSATPVAFTNFVNVVAPTDRVGGLRLDGAPLVVSWTAIGGSGYSGAQVPVAIGTHRLAHESPIVAFGIYVYGFASYDSYGWPGGLRLAPIAEACVPTPTLPGDGLDNDCDGRIDEELGNRADEDADGLRDEDLAAGEPVLPLNEAPVADSGAEVTVPERTLQSLDGTASEDPDGDPLTWTWEQVDGPPVDLLGADGPQPTFLAPEVGREGADLEFRLVVSDGVEVSAPSDVLVHVLNVNRAPIADAGADRTADETTEVALDASPSSDPDEDPLTFRWAQVSGAPVALRGVDQAVATFVAPEVGPEEADLLFLVVISDGLETREARVLLHVRNVNDPPSCEGAVASVPALWPPNHQMVRVEVLGVTDPDGDPIRITILGVTQDEAVDARGDGDTGPDAAIQGEAVDLRAEREGSGNGRVYVVSFRAEDGRGHSCEGRMRVVVPKSQRQTDAVDDGQAYDSTQAPS